MMPKTLLMSEDLNTDSPQSISSESLSYGLAISDGRLTRWTCVSAWRWSKSHESVKLLTGIVLLILSPTPRSREKWRSAQTGLIMAKITQSKRGIWCSYCIMRWGTAHVRGQTQAAWTITSFVRGKVIDRHYCFTCAKEAQTWHDGTIWSFKEQIDYKEGKQELDVQLGEL